jgi:hypothetical protein
VSRHSLRQQRLGDHLTVVVIEPLHPLDRDLVSGQLQHLPGQLPGGRPARLPVGAPLRLPRAVPPVFPGRRVARLDGGGDLIALQALGLDPGQQCRAGDLVVDPGELVADRRRQSPGVDPRL